MLRSRVTSAALAATTAVVAFTGVAGGSAAQAAPAAARHSTTGQDGPVVVVGGLNNPRQLSVVEGGGLLVAEAGTGGSQCVPIGEGGNLSCFGMTGSVSWVPLPSIQRDSNPIRVVTGLISQAAPNGAAATGASGLSARGLRDFYIAMTGIPPVTLPPDLDIGLLGKLAHSRLGGTTQAVADLAAYETANDPDQQGVESAPYAALALPGRVLVADAAGNDVLQYRDGRLSTFAVLPNIQDGTCAGLPNDNGTTGCDAVPSGMAVGPDGSIYVGGISALNPGAGRIYVLDGRTGQVKRQYTGLTAVNGVAIGPDGSIYASQLFTSFGQFGPDFTTGRVTRLRPDGSRTDIAVPAPAGLAVVGHCLYVSAWSTSPAGGAGVPDSDGQVWRLRV